MINLAVLIQRRGVRQSDGYIISIKFVPVYTVICTAVLQ